MERTAIEVVNNVRDGHVLQDGADDEEGGFHFVALELASGPPPDSMVMLRRRDPPILTEGYEVSGVERSIALTLPNTRL